MKPATEIRLVYLEFTLKSCGNERMAKESVFGRSLGMLDHEYFHWPGLGFELQAEPVENLEERGTRGVGESQVLGGRFLSRRAQRPGGMGTHPSVSML